MYFVCKCEVRSSIRAHDRATSVHREQLSGDEARVGRGKEGDGLGHFVNPPRPPERVGLLGAPHVALGVVNGRVKVMTRFESWKTGLFLYRVSHPIMQIQRGFSDYF